MATFSFPISDHCDGTRFFNPRVHINRSWRDILRWKLHAKAAKWPKQVPLPTSEKRGPHASPDSARFRCKWINHSSFSLQGSFGHALTDPVFSRAAGPWGLFGPARVHPPGISFSTLPKVDLVLLSHDHYDHCDLPSLSLLAKRDDPLLITPLGNGVLGRRAGFRRIIELDWWDSIDFQGTQVTVVPSRHWSNRITGKRNGRLWGGFWLKEPAGLQIHFVGDTAYDEFLFKEIQQRFGAPDLAMIPIGAYEPRWFMGPQHCSPEEAVQIHLDLQSRTSIGMHWGCFQLTDEPREEPPHLLGLALEKASRPASEFKALEPGEAWVIR